MNQPAFWIAAGVASLVFGLLAYWARLTGGPRRLAFATAVAALVIFAVGLMDWNDQASRETPLLTYVLLAIVPAVLSAVTLHVLASHRAGRYMQVLVASFVSFVLIPVVLMSAFFP